MRAGGVRGRRGGGAVRRPSRLDAKEGRLLLKKSSRIVSAIMSLGRRGIRISMIEVRLRNQSVMMTRLEG